MPEIVAALRQNGLHVFIVDDGSDEPARGALAALSAPEHGVSVHRLPVNQGKGGAVIAGFELAAAAGYTHALQIDADGQHDRAALADLLDAGRAHPGALILGAPIYDRSMPLGRRIGRQITHFWVAVETLTPYRLDAMCGFRIYPLAPTLSLLRHERIGRRMDFDPDILVRLLWRGVRPVTVPVRVNYPEGNISNFRLLHDNWAISRMHTRLVFSMLPRLPSILRHRREQSTHWAGLAERGAYWGLSLLAAAYRLLGRGVCLALLLPVVFYFHLTGSEQRRASRDFLRRAFAAQGAARAPITRDLLRHSFSFARKTLDTFAAWIAARDRPPVEVVDAAELARASGATGGFLMIVSHLGNADFSRAALDPDRRARLSVLVHTQHAENYARLLRRFRPDSALNTLQVTEVDPATIIRLEERIARGGWIAIAGDRTPVRGDNRVSRAAFLGTEASFPQGPYLLAHLLACPVYLMFCLREEGRYRVFFERFADRIDLPRADREEALAAWAARYARRLEAYCLRDPFQWYNFFDFWAPRPGQAGTR